MTQVTGWSRLKARLKSLLRLSRSQETPPTAHQLAGRQHILIIDGTQSRIEAGSETNAGLLYKLLLETAPETDTTLWYHSGIQGHGFWNWVTIASGWGINQVVFDGYAHLAENYRPGDRIYLFGFSRGAYAARSIAGMIGNIGLVRATSVNQSNLRFAFRLYENGASDAAKRTFQSIHCHEDVHIEMIGVWDTVKALGINYPILSRLAPMATEFHNTTIGGSVKAGYHALALDEDRTAFAPVMWDTEPNWRGQLEQVWFRGAHSDIGGHVWMHPESRPLSNIPLVWMAQKAEKHGLKLPENWIVRFPRDDQAPAIGARSGIARFFLLRKPRELGTKPGEYLHKSTGALVELTPHPSIAHSSAG